jgi:hypothetical protein
MKWGEPNLSIAPGGEVHNAPAQSFVRHMFHAELKLSGEAGFFVQLVLE